MVARPGLTTSMVMERLLKLAIVTVDVALELVERKATAHQWRQAPGLHICDSVVIFLRVIGLHFTMSPGRKKIMNSRR